MSIERFSYEEADNEAAQIEEGFRRAEIKEPTHDEYEHAFKKERALDERAEKEAVERPTRIEALVARVEMLFPGEHLADLRREIRESFDVPQFGPYHNEGLFMDTHLALIFENLARAKRGEFDADVPEEAQRAIQHIVRDKQEFFEQYALLHDIRKKDCLTIKYLDGGTGAGTWDDWKQRVPEEAKHDPRALRAFLKKTGVKQTSYFIERSGEGMVQHGDDAAGHLRRIPGLNLPHALLTAIAAHEVAYQFKSVRPKTYGKYFKGLSLAEREAALAATYLDSASSLNKDIPPRAELRNFRFLWDSKHNYERIEAARRALDRRPDIDHAKLERECTQLENVKTRIEDSPEKVIAELTTKTKRE